MKYRYCGGRCMCEEANSTTNVYEMIGDYSNNGRYEDDGDINDVVK